MAKPMLTADNIKKLINVVKEACNGISKLNNATGEAEAMILLKGDFEVEKGNVIDFRVGADIPYEVPVDGDVSTALQRGSGGEAGLTIYYKIKVVKNT